MASDTAQGSARKGAPRMSAITPEVLAALNAGHIATVNLVEFLAIDLGLLARNVVAHLASIVSPPKLASYDFSKIELVFPHWRRKIFWAQPRFDRTQSRLNSTTGTTGTR